MTKIRLFIVALLLPLIFASCGSQEEQIATNIDEVMQCRVGVISGSAHDIALSEYDPELYRTNVKGFNSLPDLLLALSNNAVDYILEDSVCCIGARLEEKGLGVAFGSDICEGDYAFAIRKGDTLRQSISAFLDSIKANGIYDEALERWTTHVLTATMPDIQSYTEGEPLRVATMPDMPFTFVQNSMWVGFEAELLLRYAEHVHRPIVFYNYDFSAMIAALKTNRVDIVSSGLFITEERLKQVDFTSSYYSTNSAILCRVADHEAVSGKSRTFAERFHNNFVEEGRWKMLVDGLWVTLIIAFFSIIFGTILGGFICWMRMHRNRALAITAKVYIELMRDIPILVFLMVMFYIVFAGTGVSSIIVAIIAFSLNMAAYVSEMFRTGIEGVDRGQTEAGLAMGFSPVRTFVYFILPQVVKKVIPVYKGEVISLIKNTSIVGYIAIQDLTKISDIIRSRTFDAFMPLIAVSIVYFVIAWLLGKLLDRLAK